MAGTRVEFGSSQLGAFGYPFMKSHKSNTHILFRVCKWATFSVGVFFLAFSDNPDVFAEQKIVIGASRFAVKSLQGGRSKVVPDRGLVWIFTRDIANGDLWRRKEIVDKDSEVIHRASFLDWAGSGRKGLLTAGANRALLKLYHPDGPPEILWNPLFTK